MHTTDSKWNAEKRFGLRSSSSLPTAKNIWAVTRLGWRNSLLPEDQSLSQSMQRMHSPNTVQVYSPTTHATIIWIMLSSSSVRLFDIHLRQRCDVRLVGYDTDPAFGDFWWIRNSWGDSWETSLQEIFLNCIWIQQEPRGVARTADTERSQGTRTTCAQSLLMQCMLASIYSAFDFIWNC